MVPTYPLMICFTFDFLIQPILSEFVLFEPVLFGLSGLVWLLLGLVHAHLTHNMLSGTVFRVTFKSLKMLSAFKYGNSPGQSNQLKKCGAILNFNSLHVFFIALTKFWNHPASKSCHVGKYSIALLLYYLSKIIILVFMSTSYYHLCWWGSQHGLFWSVSLLSSTVSSIYFLLECQTLACVGFFNLQINK